MHVCHETIYQALYVQGRGELRREVAAALRSGRAHRRPRRQERQRQPRFAAPMLLISQRPAEAADRAVPGHWEGDLIIGKGSASQIGTLVERASRYVLLVHLPADRTAETVRDALAATMAALPEQLKRSLTWDQGREMALAHEFAVAAGLPVYFCDPHSPWQRGTNENTNGLLRQYFPKGTDLSAHPRARLDAVAAELNARPRKTLDWETPAERLAKLLTPAT
jgi:IS30 family transposase